MGKWGTGNQNMGITCDPLFTGHEGSCDLLLELWYLHISGTLEAGNFNSDTHINHKGY